MAYIYISTLARRDIKGKYLCHKLHATNANPPSKQPFQPEPPSAQRLSNAFLASTGSGEPTYFEVFFQLSPHKSTHILAAPSLEAGNHERPHHPHLDSGRIKRVVKTRDKILPMVGERGFVVRVRSKHRQTSQTCDGVQGNGGLVDTAEKQPQLCAALTTCGRRRVGVGPCIGHEF